MELNNIEIFMLVSFFCVLVYLMLHEKFKPDYDAKLIDTTMVVEEETKVESIDISSMTKAQLLDVAVDRGVYVRPSWSKSRIVEAINQNTSV